MASISNTTKLLHLLALSLLTALLHSQMALSQSPSPGDQEDSDDDDESYVLDSPFSTTRLRSRFLASIKKGKSCNLKKNVCNGVKADKGTSLLYCCKMHCRNILTDRNHCGGCLNKCPLGKDCCNERCIDTTRDPSNCGKCGRKCKKGQKCGYGYCGYA